jgi:hypothetical protein
MAALRTRREQRLGALQESLKMVQHAVLMLREAATAPTSADGGDSSTPLGVAPRQAATRLRAGVALLDAGCAVRDDGLRMWHDLDNGDGEVGAEMDAAVGAFESRLRRQREQLARFLRAARECLALGDGGAAVSDDVDIDSCNWRDVFPCFEPLSERLIAEEQRALLSAPGASDGCVALSAPCTHASLRARASNRS